MENKSTDKEIKLSYENKDININPITKLIDIIGIIRTVKTVPTHIPSSLIDQIVIDTTHSRLYIYDTSSKSWKYSSLT